MTNVYIEESGNSGPFNPDQPVFALSALAISDADAERVRGLLPSGKKIVGELKHTHLCKSKDADICSGLIAAQTELIRNHPAFVYAVEYRFCIIEKMLMDCIPGDDPRVVLLQEIALDIYGEYDGLKRKFGFDKILKDYHRAISMDPDSADFGPAFSSFVKNLRAATAKSDILNYAFGGIAKRDPKCVEEFTLSCGKMNFHLSLMFGLLNELLNVVKDDVRLVFDDSPQFSGIAAGFDTPFFRKVKGVESRASHECLGIQLADILAGGARLVGERIFGCNVKRERSAQYCDLLSAIYADANIMLFQPPYLPVPTFARVPELLRKGAGVG